MAKKRSTKGVFNKAIKDIREEAKKVVENMKYEILKEYESTGIDAESIDINPTVKDDPKFSGNVEKEIKSQIPEEITVETKANTMH